MADPSAALTDEELLAKYGWGNDLEQYQEFNGLEPTGVMDAPTQRVLREPRFCSVSDREGAGGDLKWAHLAVTLAVTGRLAPRISDEQFAAALAEACGYWNEVCGLQMRVVEQARTANILSDAGAIDRAFGVLAWSELPGGDGRQLGQLYDTAEPWVISASPGNGQIDLVRVACHEIGHAIGLNHGPKGCLMAPTIAGVRKPVGWDVQEARRRYGPPATLPPPQPTPGAVQIVVEGQVSRVLVNGQPVAL